MSWFKIDPFGKEIMCRLVKVMMVSDDKMGAQGWRKLVKDIVSPKSFAEVLLLP